MTHKDLMQICSGDFAKPESEATLPAPVCSASPWTSQIRGLEERVDLVRDSAYRNKCYDISSALQDVMRALYKIRVNHNQTPNAPHEPPRA